MTAPTVTALEEGLRGRGLLPPGATPLPAEPPGRPWFVSVLLGFSGWLAGLFGLLFLGLLLKPDGAPGFALIGGLLLAGAFGLYRAAATAFVEQLALAVSIAGHVAVAVAVGMGTESAGGTAFVVAALQAAWVAIVPNRAARVLSTISGAVAWALALRFAWWGDDLGHGDQRVSLLAAVVGWGVVWGPIAFASLRAVADETRWMAAGKAPLVRPLLAGLLLALSWGTLASQPSPALFFWEPAGAGRTNWLALWPLLSACASVVALALAHALRSRPLMGAAVAAALLHVFHFYMLVGASLLVKAAILGAAGLLLLAGAVLVDRRGRSA